MSLSDDALCRALTLRERLALLQGASRRLTEDHQSIGASIVGRWRSRLPRTYERCLEAYGRPADFPIAVSLGQIPDAAIGRAAARSGFLPLHSIDGADTSISPSSKTSGISVPILQFAALAQPLIDAAVERLRLDMTDLVAAGLLDWERLVPTLRDELIRDTTRLAWRTAVLELNVARVTGVLAGGDAEARFHAFISRLHEPVHREALFHEYPVLFRVLLNRSRQWADAWRETFAAVRTHWTSLRSVFDLSPADVVVDVLPSLGDRHGGGRSVTMLGFKSGARLVYKPRPLWVDTLFGEFVDWLNALGLEPRLRTLKVLNTATAGWQEVAVPEPCRSPEAAHAFYRRLGAQLAVTYVLCGVDLHHENVIAMGDTPMLLDNETLFHPSWPLPPPSSAADVARAASLDSVLRTGLLPFAGGGESLPSAVFASGVSSAVGQKSDRPVLRWRGAGTDVMHAVRERVDVSPSQNTPTVDGNRLNVVAYAGDLLAGFERAYELIARNRSAFTASGGWLDRFREAQIRVVVRPTRTYAVLLDESLHPDFMKDAIDRDLWFDILWESSYTRPELAAVVSHEKRDLENCDIPVFRARAGSRDIVTSDGTVIPGWLPASGIDGIAKRVAALGDADGRRQRWIAKASLTALDMSSVQMSPDVIPRPIYRASSDDPAAEAIELADRLAECVFRHDDGDVSWLTIVPAPDERWRISPVQADLYDGLAGIGFLYLYLADAFGRPAHRKMRDAVLAALRRSLPELLATRQMGAFNGMAGCAYVLGHAAAILADRSIEEDVQKLIARMSELVRQDDKFDIIGGAAGCILSLLAIRDTVARFRSLDLAVVCGHHLVSAAVPAGDGIAWPASSSAEPLAGLSHGASGMGLALSRLYATTGQTIFRQAAMKAFAGEDRLYRPDARNWRDARETNDKGVQLQSTWCHGAAGIAAARAVAAESLGQPLPHIDEAIESTAAALFDLRSQSLCHGVLGNIECMMVAMRCRRAPDWHARARELVRVALAGARNKGWFCGNPLAVEAPGMMTGLAGLAYGLLRVAEPDRFPSVLLLEAPAVRAAVP